MPDKAEDLDRVATLLDDALSVVQELQKRDEQVEAVGSERMPPSRWGKKTVAGHFDPAVSRLLRQIALEEDTSVQDLLREALNDLFVKRGRPPVAS